MVVQPEELSLAAHSDIQSCIRQPNHLLTQEELNAILRLSQHLRVFGLLSAVGYINQQNDQVGQVRQRTGPVWGSLLKGLLLREVTLEGLQKILSLSELPTEINNRQLMEVVRIIAQQQPSQYMSLWRKSLVITNHWNFWARAYSEN